MCYLRKDGGRSLSLILFWYYISFTSKPWSMHIGSTRIITYLYRISEYLFRAPLYYHFHQFHNHSSELLHLEFLEQHKSNNKAVISPLHKDNQQRNNDFRLLSLSKGSFFFFLKTIPNPWNYSPGTPLSSGNKGPNRTFNLQKKKVSVWLKLLKFIII